MGLVKKITVGNKNEGYGSLHKIGHSKLLQRNDDLIEIK
jgi:hypothetical protein